jgi:hypothetical protein
MARETRNLTLPGDSSFILQIDDGDSHARRAVHAAIVGAFRRLASSRCREVLSDFTDADGRTLQANLESTGQTAQSYLGLLRYADGASSAPCDRQGILAFTSPGQRIVYFCRAFRERFLTLRIEERTFLELAILHEMLHTLGLRENPPTPGEITDRVRRRCGDR